MRTLMHGVDRYEHARIADRGRRDAAHGAFGVAMMMHIGIVEHDLPTTTQLRAVIRFALDETIDEASL